MIAWEWDGIERREVTKQHMDTFVGYRFTGLYNMHMLNIYSLLYTSIKRLKKFSKSEKDYTL